MIKPSLFGAIGSLAVLSLQCRAASFTFQSFDVPGRSAFHATGINDGEQVVGQTMVGPHGFLKDGTTFNFIDYPGATGTLAFGINDTGQIVGEYGIGFLGSHGFLLDGPTFSSFDYPGA
jgi:hypothetical protein